MTPPSSGRLARFALAGGILLLLLASLMPVQAIVGALALRFNTVAGFRGDFVAGLQTLRVALAANGLLLLAAPSILARCRLVPGGRAAMPRLEWAAAGSLYAVSLLLSLPGLAESFQDDEWRVLEQYVRHGPAVILTRSAADNHPLYSLLAWPFVALFGTGEIPVRMPALLLSPLAPALLFLLLRRDHSPGTSWLAALPLAAAPFLLQYAAEGRAYGPLVSAVLALAFLHRPMLEGHRAALTAYVGAGIAAVFLHLFAAAAVLALGAAPLLRRAARARCFAATAAIGAMSFLLYAPTLPQYFAYAAVGDGGPPMPGEGPLALAGNLLAPASSPALVLPFLAATGVALFRWKRATDLGVAFMACLMLLVALLMAIGYPLAHRYLAPAFALAWVPIGVGLASALSKPRSGLALWAAVVLATGVSDVSCWRLGRRDYRAAAGEIRARMAPGETLLVRFDGRPLTPYLPSRLPVVSTDGLMSAAPDWTVGVDLNIRATPGLEAWLGARYEEVFRLPSTRGALVGHRRR